MTNKRKMYLYLRYYLNLPLRKRHANSIICIIDNKLIHAGLVDRFKTIISAYFISKKNNIPFKILFTNPFNLSDYLIPNEYNWSCANDYPQFSLLTSRIFINSKNNPLKLDSSKEYHVYDGKDILIQLFTGNEFTNLWGDLFQELFRPSQLLNNELNNYGIEENSFIAVHLRFVNLLDSFEVSKEYKTLNSEDRQILVQKCLNTIQKIRKKEKLPIIVFSDNNTFQNLVANEDGVSVIDGKIEHISFLNDKNSVLKVFLDFFLISQSKKVYSIIYPDMYKSAFPAYAAWSNKKSFYRMEFDKNDRYNCKKITN